MTDSAVEILNKQIDGLGLKRDVPIGKAGWFRTGGNAETLFEPHKPDDLKRFLSLLDKEENPPLIVGALSNMIVRDHGIPGITVKLGREFGEVRQIDDRRIYAGGAAMNRKVANFAARSGIGGLEFLIGIPGTIGGSVFMNAGCYGTEMKDVLDEIHIVTISGEEKYLKPEDIRMTYRHAEFGEKVIVTGTVLKGVQDLPQNINAAVTALKQKREQTQPIREKTGGSTFANSSAKNLEQAGIDPDTKAWELIDKIGGRGLRKGGAMVSEKHCNFLINTGNASAADLENLGDELKRRVYEQFGIDLVWEIKRVGLRTGA